MEFVINSHIKVHPMALVRFETLADAEAKRAIAELTRGYEDRTEYFVDRLAHGLARIAAALHPRPVIVRTSDFKTNEYANLIGGREFEPTGRTRCLACAVHPAITRRATGKGSRSSVAQSAAFASRWASATSS